MKLLNWINRNNKFPPSINKIFTNSKLIENSKITKQLLINEFQSNLNKKSLIENYIYKAAITTLMKMYKQPSKNKGRDYLKSTYFSGTSSNAVPIPQSGWTSQLCTVYK